MSEDSKPDKIANLQAKLYAADGTILALAGMINGLLSIAKNNNEKEVQGLVQDWDNYCERLSKVNALKDNEDFKRKRPSLRSIVLDGIVPKEENPSNDE